MKSIIKYMTKIGQKTGTLKTSKKVHVKATIVARVAHHQNYYNVLDVYKNINYEPWIRVIVE